MKDRTDLDEWWRLRSLPPDSEPPEGAIRADHSKHAPHNSYGALNFYVDLDFVCADCGTDETWTAEQQRWWYEEAKGYIDSRAVRCRSCRGRAREEKQVQRRRSMKGRLP
jgi:hypothetical protein